MLEDKIDKGQNKSIDHVLEYHIQRAIVNYIKNDEPEGKTLNLINELLPAYRAPKMWSFYKQMEKEYKK